MATGKALDGKPHVGNTHTRFYEETGASVAMPRRGSLLRKMLCAAVCAAAASVPLVSSADEPYQYIKTPGYDPVLYSTNTCSIVSSMPAPLTTGTLSLPSETASFDARFCTWLESIGIGLNSMPYIRGFIMSFR